MGYSDPGPSPRTARRIASELAKLLDRSGIAGPVVLVGASIAGFNVRVFASDHPERAAGLVFVDASHEADAHEVPWMARFVPLLSTVGVFRLFGVPFGQRVESLPPSVRRYAQATSFRAVGYQAAADEIIHIRETVSEVRSSRRTLTIPVVVVTGARGADQNWRQLQQDLDLALRTSMFDDRSTVRPRGIGRPTGSRCERDPEGRGDSSRPRCPPVRHACFEPLNATCLGNETACT
jgi:pimeloyl-ACP methyl ester carboxylesterase